MDGRGHQVNGNREETPRTSGGWMNNGKSEGESTWPGRNEKGWTQGRRQIVTEAMHQM